MVEQDTNEGLIADEAREAIKELAGYAPLPEEKQNVHVFLNKVSESKDTTKTGFLTETEVGIPQHPTRMFKGLALHAKMIMDNEDLADYFNKESEVLTSTSLSREGFLVKQATVTRRQIEDVTKPKKENKGWFKKKEEKPGVPTQ